MGDCLGSANCDGKSQPKSGWYHSLGLSPGLCKSGESELGRKHACLPSLSAHDCGCD